MRFCKLLLFKFSCKLKSFVEIKRKKNILEKIDEIINFAELTEYKNLEKNV